jgi:hypothetical protein
MPVSSRLIRPLRSIFAAVLLLATGPVAAVVIDFEGVAPAGGVVIPATPYAEDGFVVSTSLVGPPMDGIYSATTPTINDNGSDIFGWCGVCTSPDPIVVSVADAGSAGFNAVSIDASHLLTDIFVAGKTLELTGLLSGGGTVVQTLDLVENT